MADGIEVIIQGQPKVESFVGEFACKSEHQESISWDKSKHTPEVPPAQNMEKLLFHKKNMGEDILVPKNLLTQSGLHTYLKLKFMTWLDKCLQEMKACTRNKMLKNEMIII